MPASTPSVFAKIMESNPSVNVPAVRVPLPCGVSVAGREAGPAEPPSAVVGLESTSTLSICLSSRSRVGRAMLEGLARSQEWPMHRLIPERRIFESLIEVTTGGDLLVSPVTARWLLASGLPRVWGAYRRARQHYGLRPVRVHGSNRYLLRDLIEVGEAMDIEAEA